MAERKGFEPLIPLGILAFQASALDQLCDLSGQALIISEFFKNKASFWFMVDFKWVVLCHIDRIGRRFRGFWRGLQNVREEGRRNEQGISVYILCLALGEDTGAIRWFWNEREFVCGSRFLRSVRTPARSVCLNLIELKDGLGGSGEDARTRGKKNYRTSGKKDAGTNRIFCDCLVSCAR